MEATGKWRMAVGWLTKVIPPDLYKPQRISIYVRIRSSWLVVGWKRSPSKTIESQTTRNRFDKVLLLTGGGGLSSFRYFPEIYWRSSSTSPASSIVNEPLIILIQIQRSRNRGVSDIRIFIFCYSLLVSSQYWSTLFMGEILKSCQSIYW